MIHHCLILLIWAPNNLNPKEEEHLFWIKSNKLTISNIWREFSPRGKPDPQRAFLAVRETRQLTEASDTDFIHGDEIWASGPCLVSCQLTPTHFLAQRSCLSFLGYVDVLAAKCACLIGRHGRDLWEPHGPLQLTSWSLEGLWAEWGKLGGVPDTQCVISTVSWIDE